MSNDALVRMATDYMLNRFGPLQSSWQLFHVSTDDNESAFTVVLGEFEQSEEGPRLIQTIEGRGESIGLATDEAVTTLRHRT